MIEGHQENLDWLRTLEDDSSLKAVIAARRERYGRLGPLFLPVYKARLSRGEFLVPAYLMWRKELDAADLLESQTISLKRKKYLRKALVKSGQLGVEYRLVNPVAPVDFDRFINYYRSFCLERGYRPLLREDYYRKRRPHNIWLIEVWRGEEYLGGRLVSRYGDALSTDYRAIARTREIKEGYDIVCEKIYFDLGAGLGVRELGRGKELNLRGLAGKRIGMLWNKLKYGYRPVVAPIFPYFYADYAFLRGLDFSLVFFVSIENDAALWRQAEDGVQPGLQLNFVCADGADRREIQAVMEKSPYPVRVWDRDFNDLTAEMAGSS